ncbi:MAG: hypothetical protein IPM95_03370 [Sphingobacteriales bacterium]|nr:hypothetical protein [Sphingobacteriales bacterium]
MLSKKFSCKRCGAPKVNAYHSPFVICDFCANLIDVDYTMGYKIWQNEQEAVKKYEIEKVIIESQLQQLLTEQKKEAYEKLQFHYWDYYYRAFPHYLPPTVNTPDIYQEYVEAAAKMSADYAFSPELKQLEKDYQAKYSGLAYHTKGNKSYVTWDTFEPMLTHYIKIVKLSFRACYDNPDYAIMHQVLPEDIHFRLKISQLAQVWLPYMEEDQSSRLLELLGLNYEYADYSHVTKNKHHCSQCQYEQLIPENSIQFICEKCHCLNPIKSSINCTSCGIENKLTENWKEVMNCSGCGTEIRIVTPLFG